MVTLRVLPRTDPTIVVTLEPEEELLLLSIWSLGLVVDVVMETVVETAGKSQVHISKFRTRGEEQVSKGQS